MYRSGTICPRFTILFFIRFLCCKSCMDSIYLLLQFLLLKDIISLVSLLWCRYMFNPKDFETIASFLPNKVGHLLTVCFYFFYSFCL